MKRTIPLIVGNWKLHPSSIAAAEKLAAAIVRTHKQTTEPYIAVAPSFIHLPAVAKQLRRSTVRLAAQDVAAEPMGAFTGEVSAMQLRDAGVDFVIIGHSERRAMGETDEVIQQKVLLTLKNKLTPIVCIGERERDDRGDFFNVVQNQLQLLCDNLTPAQVKKLIIAYEPIWAIGTGQTATTDDVKEMQLFIISVLTTLFNRKVAAGVRLLYGGSVKPHNAAALQQAGGMHGFLVGGASLTAKDFLAISHASL
jgi:triosephosphate isomerase